SARGRVEPARSGARARRPGDRDRGARRHLRAVVTAIRHAEPDDHARVAAVLDDWWGGRRMRDMLPRLFFVHFRETSFVAEEAGELVGFLCGFLSQTHADEAYCHSSAFGRIVAARASRVSCTSACSRQPVATV